MGLSQSLLDILPLLSTDNSWICFVVMIGELANKHSHKHPVYPIICPLCLIYYYKKKKLTISRDITAQ